MAKMIFYTIIYIVIINCYLVSSDEQCPLANTNDLIEDSNCPIAKLNDLNNQRLYPLLHKIVDKNYFRFYPVNLRKKCLFWSDDGHCSRRTCAIKQCSVEKLPEPLRDKVNHLHEPCATIHSNSSLGIINKDISEQHKQTIQTWMQFDDGQSDNFCDVDDETSVDLEYIDLSVNLERYTGYTGPSTQRVWSAIYNENCFFLPDSKIYYDLRQKRLNAHKMCLEGRTFYRLVSGLHTSITIHLCAQYFFPTIGGGYTGLDGRWGPNFDEFQRRFDPQTTDGEGPKWLKNVYFIYLIELRAIYKARNVFNDQTFFTGNETDDSHTKELFMNQFMKEIEPLANYFDEDYLFQDGKELLKVEFKDHFRNISHIMDCVGCDKCKLWGKLQVQALGTALKILFTEHPIQLQRSEIVSLINGFNRLSTSVYQLEHTFKKYIKKDS
ncbi:unnamed protein product [Rotaria magnacalcarata]|uniref:Uncharacterized protein n=1 Tax=Rotaria magnacalcarata TaxID=392030 RepID=A0A815QJM3_9BILA|nr:unnamed protein product [Rotaria magnacalcarata]CAF1462807.1 unnamed protein product [Rotaria magnacalcarata]CAF2035879.1 unnamed protein product [Rotaria magnacalcarata]CAF2119079.1 unnamed protein product [Rotaria magnacalcarata]CAF3729038.1 unnamed protein product [Rotaria magnacalcarata]